MPSLSLRRFRDRTIPNALVAAATRLTFDRRTATLPKTNATAIRLWEFYDTNGMVKDAYMRFGGLVSRVRWVPAYRVSDDMDAPPIPISEAVDSGDCPQALADAVTDSIARFDNPKGGQPGIAYAWAINLGLVGDSIIVGQVLPDGREAFDVYSTDEITEGRSGGGYEVLPEPGASRGEPIPDGSVVFRAWRRHPRYRNWADSGLRGELDDLESLSLLMSGDQALFQSRIANSGLLLFDKSMDLPDIQGATDGSTANKPSRFLSMLSEAMNTAITTPGAASAVVPIVLGVDPGVGAQGQRSVKDLIEHVTFDRPLSKEDIEKANKLERKIAGVLPLPIELILGVGDINHWGVWSLDDQAYKQWVKPIVDTQTDALTTAWLRPELEARMAFAPEQIARCYVWDDPSDLLQAPDRTDDLREGWRDGVVGSAAYRAAINVPDEQAPTPEDMILWEKLKGVDKTTYRGVLEPGKNEGPPPVAQDGGPPPAVEPPVKASGALGSGQSVPAPTGRAEGSPHESDGGGILASGTPTGPLVAAGAADVGRLLNDVDRMLFARLHQASDAALSDMLRKAGTRLKARVQSEPTLKAKVNRVPPTDTGKTLGAEVVTAAGIDVDSLFNGSLDDLATTYDSLVSRAQRQAVQIVNNARPLLARGSIDPDEKQSVQSVQDDHRKLGWAVLAASLARLARERVFDPHPDAPVLGEHDPLLQVPAVLIRQSLAVAGGAPTPEVKPSGALALLPDGQPAAGTATGPDVHSLIRSSLRAVFVGHLWVHGDPAVPFEPHADLDGVEFDSFDSDVLANPDSFPATDYLRPGDHAGCTCSFIPIIGPIGETP